MHPYASIEQIFNESIAVKHATLQALAEKIGQATNLMLAALRSQHKILSCGNGGSAADAQHFAGEMINRLLIERAPLPALALSTDTSVITAIANDYGYTQVFAKQVSALGNAGDILLAISTSGDAENLVQAITAAHNQGLKVIALTGKNGGKIAAILNDQDIELRVAADKTPRIQETHILIIHCLCELIENSLFRGKP